MPLRSSGLALPSALKSWITPPDELPYSAENGPRNTSMRSAESRLKFDTWPEPSGIVAGMPSVYRRTPRTPNVERAPKPRIETCSSCATFCRLRTSTPGTPSSTSDRFTPSRACATLSSGTESIAAATSTARRSLRVAVTTTFGSVSGCSCVAGNRTVSTTCCANADWTFANIANKSSQHETRRRVSLPWWKREVATHVGGASCSCSKGTGGCRDKRPSP